MTSPENDVAVIVNPPAFPFSWQWDLPDGEHMWRNHDGMSLRDWFAGQALAGAMANHGSYGAGNGPGDIAVRAYEIADAMIAERQKVSPK